MIRVGVGAHMPYIHVVYNIHAERTDTVILPYMEETSKYLEC